MAVMYDLCTEVDRGRLMGNLEVWKVSAFLLEDDRDRQSSTPALEGNGKFQVAEES